MKKRILGILLSFALMLTMLPVLGLSQTAYAATEYTSLEVGYVLHVGDSINSTTEYKISDAVYLLPNFNPWTLVRAGIDGDKIVDNPEGSYYCFKSKNGFYTMSYDPNSGDVSGAYFEVTNTSDGIEVTSVVTGGDETVVTFAVHEPVKYPLWVGGTRVTSANMSGPGWSYTPATTEGGSTTPATLTLNNYTYTSSSGNHEGFAIYADENLILELEGTNNVDSTPVEENYGAIYVKNQLKVQGEGSLNAKGKTVGIYSYGLTIEGCNVIASSTVTTEVEFYDFYSGIYSSDTRYDITIKNATVKANTVRGNAIDSGKNVIIENSTVEAHSTNLNGIYSVGGNNVEINDGSHVTASGENRAIHGKVKNSIAGTGWTDSTGTGAGTPIAVNTTEDLSGYKRVQFPAAHTHSFTYSADGATITATCSKTDCPLPDHKATLTIGAPAHNTYGDGKSAEATITDEHSIKGEAAVVYKKGTETLTSAPTDAGTYTASITVGGANASVEYTIAKADPTANAPSGLTATYGQTLSDVTLTNPQGNTPGTWTWKDPGTTSVGNVGDNTFKANFTPTDAANYKSVEDVDVIITVGKAANPATVTSTASVKVGGSKVDLAQNVNKNGATGAVTYSISGGDQGCSISGSELTSGANTGSVTVNVAVAEDDNYNASAAMPITVTITSKDTQTITADDVTVAYGDTGKKIEASTSGDGALSYEVKAGGEYIDVDKSTGMLTVKKPGSAIVTVTAAETSSYAEAAKDVNVTATKAEPTAAAVTANNRKYDGTKKPLVTVDESILVGGTMQYALGKDAKTAPEEGWSETIPSAAEKGTYYVWYMVKGDANHNDSEPQSVTVTISEKGPEPVDESTITFDLNGGTLNGKTGKVAVKVNNGTVITLPEPTRDGYTFDYWEGSKYNAGDQYTVNGDHTFKAVWKTADKGGSKGGSSSGKNGVKTGDENTLGAWIVLLVAALAGTTGMVFARKRK